MAPPSVEQTDLASALEEIARPHAELKAANEKLARRKVVERAKGLLQEERGLTEQQAYEYLRSTSRRRRITLPALSEEIIRARTTRHLGQAS